MIRSTALAITLSVLLPGSYAAAQSDTVSRWKIGVSVSPEMGYRYLVKKSSYNDSTGLIAQIIRSRDKQEFQVFAFTAGLSVERSFAKRFTLRSGIHYSLRGEKTKNVIVMDLNNIGSYLEADARQHYHYIGIPLYLSCGLLNKEKVRLFASLGTDLNFFYLRSLHLTYKHNGSTDYFTEKPQNSIYEYYTFIPSAYASIGIDLKVSPRSTVRIEPCFRYSARPLVNAPINGYYYNYGLNLGYLLTI